MRKKSLITSLIFTIINVCATIYCLILNVDLSKEGTESIALLVIVPLSFILFGVIILSSILGIIFSVRGLRADSRRVRIISRVLLVLNIIMVIILSVMMFRIFSLSGE